MKIRRASVADAEAIVTVLRRSITELCVADHHNDPSVLGAWLENKTASNVRAWIESPRAFMVVAEIDGVVSGIASLGATGGILLCYSLPEVQATGVGRALLAALETEAARLGLRSVSLESTLSARGFYLKQGYVPSSDGKLTKQL